MEYYCQDITEKIISCFYKVYNRLGYGFLEKVYENTLCVELQNEKMNFLQQSSVQVFYDENIVGNFVSDLIVEEKVIVEVKAITAIRKEHDAQLLNYLKATKLEVGLLLNFGSKPEVRRRAYTFYR
jgi:GxxExxY protein